MRNPIDPNDQSSGPEELKALARWRARFYREAATRRQHQAENDSDSFDAWYRDELDKAPPVDDEAAFATLWQTLDEAITIGTRLRAIRKHYRLTQIDMAAIAAVEQGTVSRWESGETDITDTHLAIYSHLCQGAALAFLRYGAASLPPARDPAIRRSFGVRVVGRVGTGLGITPIEEAARIVDLAPLTIALGDHQAAQTELVALEIDDAPDLYPLRPGWLVIYEAVDKGAPAWADSGGLIGRSAPLETCLKRLCVVGLNASMDDRGNAGRVLLREVRAAREPGRYALATFRTYEVENAEIAWASPVLALLPPHESLAR